MVIIIIIKPTAWTENHCFSLRGCGMIRAAKVYFRIFLCLNLFPRPVEIALNNSSYQGCVWRQRCLCLSAYWLQQEFVQPNCLFVLTYKQARTINSVVIAETLVLQCYSSLYNWRMCKQWMPGPSFSWKGLGTRLGLRLVSNFWYRIPDSMNLWTLTMAVWITFWYIIIIIMV